MRLLRLLAVNLLASIVLVELAAVVVVYLRYGDTYWSASAARRAAARLIPESVLDRIEPPEPNAATFEQFRLNAPRRIHPYFSFTYDPDVMPANNFGFLDVDLPYRPRPGEFVVAIFGGSFAQHLGDEEPRSLLAKGLLEWVAPKGYTSVRILNFGLGGWRMPSSMFAYYYFFSSFHMAIVVDGFNETQTLPRGASLPKTHRAFDFPTPQIWSFLLSRTVGSGGGLDELRVKLAELRDRQRSALAWADRPPWRYSMLTQLLWRSRSHALEREIQTRSSTLLEATDRPTRYARVATEGRDPVDEFFETYSTRLRLMAKAAASEGKVFAHFVQPNQYVPGSKRYSAEERRSALGSPVVRERVDRYYPRLLEMSQGLRRSGVFSFAHLVYAFQNSSETLYEDPCCHMNARGRALVAEAIVARIQRSKLLAGVPPAGS